MSEPKAHCCWCTYLRNQANVNLKVTYAWGRCFDCYRYRKRNGFDRTLEVLEAQIERDTRKLMSLASL